MRRFTTCLAVLALMLLAACGGGGISGVDAINGGGASSPSGEVTLSIKDAPLSALQTFTIDVSKATLKGAGTTADAQIFPTSTANAAPVTIDLLSVQGFNQLLASQSVPTGAYHSIELEYANPQAVDNQNVLQNITTQGTKVFGVFAPALVVSTNSQQSIQVDVDLQSSVFDLGGNNMLFSAVVKVGVLNQARPIKRFPAVVLSTNVANDSFMADIIFYGANAPKAGRITVQCDAMTTYNDGNGSITTGGVTAKLSAKDLVEIDGSILHSTVKASSIVRLGQAQTSPGNPNAPRPPILGPPVHTIGGTLIAVDTQAGTITIGSRHQNGPGGTNAANAMLNGQPSVIATTANTKIHRGSLSSSLSALVLGNWIQAIGDVQQNTFTARDIEEGPAFITGVVDTVAANGGVNNQDRITFFPETVDQTPVSQLAFVPPTLDVDIPAPHGFQVNTKIQVIAFFVANTNLLEARAGRGGNVTGTAVGGGNTTGGGHGGVTTPLPAPAKFGFFGEIAANTNPHFNGNGELEFVLQLGANASALTNRLTVTVPAATQILRTSVSNNQTQTATISHAQAEIDLKSGNFMVDAVGSKAPVHGQFEADIEVHLIDRTALNSAPIHSNNLPGFPAPPMGGATGSGGNSNGGNNTGGGSVGGNPGGNTGGGSTGGNNTPPILTSVLVGTVSGTAILNANSEIVFTLVMPSGPGVQGGSVTVTVGPNAILALVTVSNANNSGGNAAGGPTTARQPLTLPQAVAALNSNPVHVQVTGVFNHLAMTMKNVQELVIFK